MLQLSDILEKNLDIITVQLYNKQKKALVHALIMYPETDTDIPKEIINDIPAQFLFMLIFSIFKLFCSKSEAKYL
jgi:hypothetical protein